LSPLIDSFKSTFSFIKEADMFEVPVDLRALLTNIDSYHVKLSN